MPKDEKTYRIDETTLEDAASEYDLTDSQIAAMRQAINAMYESGIAFLVGHAGTGKTHVAMAIREYIKNASDDEVFITTSTHAAGKVLSEKYRVEPVTTSSFFHDAPMAMGDGLPKKVDEDSDTRKERLLSGAKALAANVNGQGWVINDETSMNGARQCLALRQLAAEGRFNVLLVGDDQQLKPIANTAAGELESFMFTNLVAAFDIPIIRLTEIVRQGKSNPIRDWAEKVRTKRYTGLICSPILQVNTEGETKGIGIVEGDKVAFVQRAVDKMGGRNPRPEDALLVAHENAEADWMNAIALKYLYGPDAVENPLDYCQFVIAQKALFQTQKYHKDGEDKFVRALAVPNGAFLSILNQRRITLGDFSDVFGLRNTEDTGVGGFLETLAEYGVRLYSAEVVDPGYAHMDRKVVECFICTSEHYDKIIAEAKQMGRRGEQHFRKVLSEYKFERIDKDDKSRKIETDLYEEWIAFRADPKNGLTIKVKHEDFMSWVYDQEFVELDKDQKKAILKADRIRRSSWRIGNQIAENLLSLKPPFARTIHKAQGLTTKVLYTTKRSIDGLEGKPKGGDDRKRLYYTALTRPSHIFVVYYVIEKEGQYE